MIQLAGTLPILEVCPLLCLTWGRPVFTTIDLPGAARTLAYDLNNRGQVVGAYTDAPNTVHGFLLFRGVFTTVDFPGATETYPWGISEDGQITGYYKLDGKYHSFIAFPDRAPGGHLR